MLNPVFEKFAEKSPIPVMARAIGERLLNPNQLDEWFDKTAKNQYTNELLFSTVFDIMSQVVLGSRPSVNAAYQASKEEIGVSIASLYNKLNGIEINTSAELVRFAAGQAVPIIQELGGTSSSPLPGFHLKLIDGNCIEKSEHRIKGLRDTTAGPLPGKSLVVYDPVLRLPIDVFPCEDGHAQERSLFSEVLPTIKKNDVWVGDRNFCTCEFTCEFPKRDAFCIIREHKNYPCKPLGEETYVGKTDTGKVYEQLVSILDESGKEHVFRRIRVKLKTETRDGDMDLFIITNLPVEVADAKKISLLYRDRWMIETAFQELTEHFNSEINSLGYPGAALFGFCVALVSYMMLSVIKAALGSVYGYETIEKQVSGYYLADEISGVSRGMMIAIPEEEWTVFRHMKLSEFLKFLENLASNVNLSAFKKNPRGKKKPPPKRDKFKNKPHVSTAKILAERKKR